MRRPSRESAWQPLHDAASALPAMPVTCCSGLVSPKLLTQICPPVPLEVTVDFQ